MVEQRFLTAQQVADTFGVKAGTVRGWVRDKRIPCIRLSQVSVRFDLAEVISALRSGGSSSEHHPAQSADPLVPESGNDSEPERR